MWLCRQYHRATLCSLGSSRCIQSLLPKPQRLHPKHPTRILSLGKRNSFRKEGNRYSIPSYGLHLHSSLPPNPRWNTTHQPLILPLPPRHKYIRKRPPIFLRTFSPCKSRYRGEFNNSPSLLPQRHLLRFLHPFQNRRSRGCDPTHRNRL